MSRETVEIVLRLWEPWERRNGKVAAAVELQLKGKTEPVPAWVISPDSPAR